MIAPGSREEIAAYKAGLCTVCGVAPARRMQAAGEPVATIAAALGVSRATVYRVLADE